MFSRPSTSTPVLEDSYRTSSRVQADHCPHPGVRCLYRGSGRLVGLSVLLGLSTVVDRVRGTGAGIVDWPRLASELEAVAAQAGSIHAVRRPTAEPVNDVLEKKCTRTLHRFNTSLVLALAASLYDDICACSVSTQARRGRGGKGSGRGGRGGSSDIASSTVRG